jgi:hypothetical protein
MKRVKDYVVVVGVGVFLIMVTLAKVRMEKRKKKEKKNREGVVFYIICHRMGRRRSFKSIFFHEAGSTMHG